MISIIRTVVGEDGFDFVLSFNFFAKLIVNLCS